MKRIIVFLLIYLIHLPISFLIVAQDTEGLFTGEIGVQMYSFRNIVPEIGIEATLDIIRDMGITEIEGGVPGGLTPEEFRNLCEERGISIPSTGAGYEQLVNNLDEIAERAKALGSNYVMVAWIPHETGNFSYENARQAVEDFNTAGMILSEHGLTFKYHFHGYEMREHGDSTLLEYIIENTNPAYVSFQLDIFWAYFGGADPAELLTKYSNRFVSLHLKDMHHGIEKNLTGLTNPEYNVVIGTGELDIHAIMKAAKDAEIMHYFIEDESSRVLEQIPQSIEYLRSL
jgi:sugar phosphate isomerase/epimerase